MVECGDHKKRDECHCGEGLDDVLAPLLLGAHARTYPPLEQFRIIFHQVNSDRERAREKNGDNNPCLPIVERPRRKENRQPENYKKLQDSSECFDVQLVHFAAAMRSLFERAVGVDRLIFENEVSAFRTRHRSSIAGNSVWINSKNASVSAIRAPAGVSRPTTSIPSRRLRSHRSSTWSLRAIASYQVSLCTR